ncbi:MAG: hypothetical protein JNL79_34945 [Myxococcales bacterium]|nr:hypothetical protein [Myxococcales bacterium]
MTRQLLVALLTLSPVLGAHAAQAQEAPRPPAENRVGATLTLGYTMGWIFGVPIRYGEAQIAAHWTRQRGESGLDLGGMVSIERGSTEAGRAMNALTFGARFVYRWDLLRFGFGMTLGQVGIRRSTRADDPQTSLVFDPFLSAGFEPLRWDGHALFLELQGHLVDMKNPATTFALGVRY